jgi:hypothetical protein
MATWQGQNGATKSSKMANLLSMKTNGANKTVHHTQLRLMDRITGTKGSKPKLVFKHARSIR